MKNYIKVSVADIFFPSPEDPLAQVDVITKYWKLMEKYDKLKAKKRRRKKDLSRYPRLQFDYMAEGGSRQCGTN